MDALDMVLRAYDVGACKRRCVMCCCRGCCPSYNESLEKKHFFKKWPNISKACEPDNIKWQNLGATQ
jgi:hypothetical protein